jgi:hypothetical protein
MNELNAEIPKIGKYHKANYTISNKCPTPCNIKIGTKSFDVYSPEIRLEHSISLVKTGHKEKNICIRKYLYKLLKDTTANSFNIGNYVGFIYPILGGIDFFGIRINGTVYKTTTDFSDGENTVSDKRNGWEIKNCKAEGIREGKKYYSVKNDNGKNGY